MTMQLDMFRRPRAPAKPKPRTMHVIDAGDRPGDGRNGSVRLCCDLCGHETDWVPSRGVTAEQKGRVCPVCKGDPAKVKKGSSA